MIQSFDEFERSYVNDPQKMHNLQMHMSGQMGEFFDRTMIHRHHKNKYTMFFYHSLFANIDRADLDRLQAGPHYSPQPYCPPGAADEQLAKILHKQFPWFKQQEAQQEIQLKIIRQQEIQLKQQAATIKCQEGEINQQARIIESRNNLNRRLIDTLILYQNKHDPVSYDYKAIKARNHLINSEFKRISKLLKTAI